MTCPKPAAALAAWAARGCDTVKNFGRFMVVADAFASFSKDTTKVGAVVVDNLGVVRSAGWNGAPRGSDADEDERAE